MDLELGNSTAAFTNFLASVYKSELVLEPQDILAWVVMFHLIWCNKIERFNAFRLYSSPEQLDKGYYVVVNDIFPLPHSVLVLVDTTTPLIASIDDLGWDVMCFYSFILKLTVNIFKTIKLSHL